MNNSIYRSAMDSFLNVFFDHASQRDLVNDFCEANNLYGVVYEWDTPAAPPPPQPAPSRPDVPNFMDLFGTEAKPVISHFAPNEVIDVSDEEEDVKVVGGGEKRKTIIARIECKVCHVMIGGYGREKTQHAMLHLRDTPFHCPQCEYTGKQRRYVLRHMRIHKHHGDIINSLDQQEVARVMSECFSSSNSAPLNLAPANQRRGKRGNSEARQSRKRRDEWGDDDDRPLAPPRTVTSDNYHIPHRIVRTDMAGSFRVEAADGQKLLKKEEPCDSKVNDAEMAGGEMGKEEQSIIKQETESPSRITDEVTKQETSDGATMNNDDVETQRNSSKKAGGSGKKKRNDRRTTATITCQLCHKTMSLSSRYYHVFAHYSNYAPPPFQCPQCGRGFHWKSGARKHMRTQGCGGEVVEERNERVYARVQAMCFGDAVIVKKEEPEEDEVEGEEKHKED